jgi:hypothetical protein
MDIYQKQIGALRIDPREFGIGEIYSYLQIWLEEIWFIL